MGEGDKSCKIKSNCKFLIHLQVKGRKRFAVVTQFISTRKFAILVKILIRELVGIVKSYWTVLTIPGSEI